MVTLCWWCNYRHCWRVSETLLPMPRSSRRFCFRNWAGFYLARGEELVLGPFQGKVACVRIPFGRGVCGAAAATGETQRVEDVHAFAGHIACDSASSSELVVPLFKHGRLLGVLDLDSPSLARFSAADQAGIERLVEVFIELTEC